MNLDRIYDFLPISLQNHLISIRGYFYYKERFSGSYNKYFERACERLQWPEDQLLKYQLKELTRLINHAINTTEYYSKTLKNYKQALSSVEDLSRLPVLHKSDLRNNTQQFFSNIYSRKDRIPGHTSGTTGTPLHFYITKDDMQKNMSYLYRMLLQFGYELGHRSIRFSGRTIFNNTNKNSVFWRFNKPMNQLLMSSYHLKEENLKNYLDKIHNFDPVMIDGYPSSIYVLANYIINNNLIGYLKPKLIMTTAETLFDYQRETISTAFSCPVINQYSSSEGAPFITQDIDGSMKINIDTGIFEYVKPGTTELFTPNPGEKADLLVTSFKSYAMPLIRYAIGDSIVMGECDNTLGQWNTPCVEKILGRAEDYLYSTERGLVGRLDPVFKKTPPTIVECQIVQIADNDIMLNIVKGQGYKDTDIDGVIDELKKRLGNKMNFQINFCEKIERNNSHKFKAVVGLKEYQI